MLDRMLNVVTRRALGALAFTTLLSTASHGYAMALPPGLEENCALTSCLVRYWSEEAGGNGHYYGFVPISPATTWTEAFAQASGSSIGDDSVGYLATITSIEEQAFVSGGLLPVGGRHKDQVWIGGMQDESTDPAAGWGWVTPSVIIPESWDYTNWAPGEPNDDDGVAAERYLTMWVHYYQNGFDYRGTWNDEDLSASVPSPIIGMLIEWEAPDSVPEPGTAALLALGAGGLVALRRRARA
jgi:hypothetical protein